MRAAARADARTQGDEIVAERGLEFAHFRHRTHDAGAARVPGEACEARRDFHGSARQAQRCEVAGGMARENRDREHARCRDAEFGGPFRGGLDGGGEHLGTSERMHREQRHTRPQQRLHGGVDGTRDIVQLDVEHVRGFTRFKQAQQLRTVAVEGLVTDLEGHIAACQRLDQTLRSDKCRNIESDDEASLHPHEVGDRTARSRSIFTEKNR
jgi:hypothetical protein